ncbi:MAG: cytochrome c oxidase subunit II [Armatimonadetes bacterium]|nr:cytochrome c oxidase subunit II [Armatimonadota bacterium]MBS1702290.1 cytochrome c oxidase subunit II [Armatimonadota bacterium]
MNLANFPFAPPAASNFASEMDTLFYSIFGLSVFFAVVTFFFVVFYAFRYRAGSSADRSSPVYENMKMEVIWIVVPTILAIIFFGWGAKVYADVRIPPKDAKEIYVVGKQWMWHIQHPNGVRENNTLHVPIDTDIKLTMISQDVIHAFYIPAFRVQFMVVPGRYTQMWFRPTQIGTYHLFCNMYCGAQHSEMGGSVIVMSKKDYAEWLANNGSMRQNLTPAQAGEKLFTKIGCANCHGPVDMPPRAPSLAGLYGKTREMTNGQKLLADETYIREAILRPSEAVLKGYDNTMPAYDKQISEDDIMSLIAFIKAGAMPSLPASNLAAGSAGTEAQVKGKAGLNANALEYNAERADATPTERGSSHAVGAMAAEKVDQKR